MEQEEYIRTVLENYDNETLKDALALLLAENVQSSNNVIQTRSNANFDSNFSNFAQAISWLKSKFKFQELDAFSTEADLVYVNTGDRKVLLTDTTVKQRELQNNFTSNNRDNFEDAWENITSNKNDSHNELQENVENKNIKEEKIEQKDDFENAFEPKQKNSRFSNLEL
jgi:hypothetical protein